MLMGSKFQICGAKTHWRPLTVHLRFLDITGGGTLWTIYWNWGDGVPLRYNHWSPVPLHALDVSISACSLHFSNKTYTTVHTTFDLVGKYLSGHSPVVQWTRDDVYSYLPCIVYTVVAKQSASASTTQSITMCRIDSTHAGPYVIY